MVILLIVMGVLFSLLFVINSMVRAVQGREKVSFFETLLTFLALVFPVLALVTNNDSTSPLLLVNQMAIGLGAVLVVVSIVTFIIEQRKSARPVTQRRGILGAGLGLLIVAATFVAPVAARFQQPAQVPAAAVANTEVNSSNRNVADVGSANGITSNPTATSRPPTTVPATQTPDAPLLQMSATPTRFPSPMPTATNTPFIIATTNSQTTSNDTQSVEQESSISIAGCIVVTRQNVNLRSGPATTFDLLLTIPFSTTLNVSAKNAGADWWFVRYQNQTGWVSGEYVNADANCDVLPTKAG